MVRAALAQFEAARPNAARLALTRPSSIAVGLDIRADAGPRTIPGYSIDREIYRGGQGVVYEARQDSTGRTVAIKVMREGALATDSERARFEREVRILGQLKHPNIVAVYDSGVFDGRAFFVMDYIPGCPLDQYVAGLSARSADGKALIDDVLHLFQTICEAINVAHLRGIIHRDMKPGNVRVDPSGQPHVLDFGLAKLSEHDALADSGAAAMTMTGQFVGSLPWSAPEQATGSSADIDIRTDVYALGVMLYQMLTGRFPYDLAGTVTTVFRRIATAEPIRPRTLNPRINDEIETLVLKCLAKDRERRYQSAGDLARDIARYRGGEPIEAKRDSLTYVLRRQLRRYRWPATIAAAFLVTIMVGLFASLYLWRDAVVQRDRARDAEAQSAQRQAEAETVTKLLSSILTSANPTQLHGPGYTVREALDAFDARLGDSLADQPRTELAIRAAVGDAYRLSNDAVKAEPHLRRRLALALQLQDADVGAIARAHLELGHALRDRGLLGEAEQEYRAALTRLQREESPSNEVLPWAYSALAGITTQTARYDEAEEYLQKGIAIAETLQGPSRNVLGALLHNLASLRIDLGRPEEAVELYRKCVEVYSEIRGPRDPDVAVNLHDLAGALSRSGRLDEAEPLLAESMALIRETLGEDHVTMAIPLQTQAGFLKARGRNEEAEPLLRRALALFERAGRHRHAQMAAVWNDLGVTLMDLKRDEESGVALSNAIEILRECYPMGHPTLAMALNNLAQVQFRAGDAPAAEASLREALQLDRRLLPKEHENIVDDLRGLSQVLERQNRPGETVDVLREILAVYQRALDPESERIATIRLRIATQLAEIAANGAAENDAGAIAAAEECLGIREDVLPAGHWRIASARSILGHVRAMQGLNDEARTLLENSYSELRDAPAEAADATARAKARLLAFYDSRGMTDAATALRSAGN